jgi:hypothetical protein
MNPRASGFRLRRLGPALTDASSWQAVRELCCRTGDSGKPVARERWEFFARVWIEPYEKLVPEWTYIGESNGEIIGYLTGCPDTARFAKVKRWRCNLPLLVAAILGRYRRVGGAAAFARRALGLTANPEDYFDSELKPSLELHFPAHLHVNVDADHRLSGVGRRLVEQYLFDLESAGVPGVHLICGADPLGFYRRLEFRELGRAQIGGMPIFLLVRNCK